MTRPSGALLRNRFGSRQRHVVLATGVLTIGVAWWLLTRLTLAHGHALFHPQRAADGFLTWTLAASMWQLMMVAMMLPVVLPWLGMVTVTHADEGDTGFRAVAWFACGYFAAWAIYSTVAATVQVSLQSLAAFDETLALRAPIAGIVLIATGAFQFTPMKRACLKHCRSPLGYLLTNWNDRPPGVFRLGLWHGSYCVACCWALMALAFALGLMNLAWMAVVTILAVAEQTAPGGERIAGGAGAGLIAWGLLLTVW